MKIKLFFIIGFFNLFVFCSITQVQADTNSDNCITQCLISNPQSQNFCASQCGTLPIINLDLDSQSQTILPFYLGYNTGYYSVVANAWNNSSFHTAVLKQKAGTLRFPGGTVANYWDWQNGWVFPNANGTPFGLGNTPAVPNHLEDFQRTVTATGVTPIFVLNLLTSTLDSQLAMLHHAQSLGLPIKYVELGNEFYLSDQDNVSRFPTGADYGNVATIWSAAIHKDFPGVKIAAVGSLKMVPFYSVSWPSNPRQDGWNTSMYTTLNGIDAITFHPYNNSNINTLSNSDYETMFGMPYSQWEELQINELAKVPAGINVWMTEFNQWGTPAPAGGTWGQGLANALEVLLFLDNNKITLINYTSILGNSDDGALFSNIDAFNNPWINNRKTPPFPQTLQFDQSANGWTQSLLANTMKDMASLQKISFTPNPNLHGGPANNAYPSFIGYKFSNRTKDTAILLNASNVPYSIKINKLNLSVYEHYFTQPAVYISNNQMVNQRTATISNDTILFPPYSIVILSGRQTHPADFNSDSKIDLLDFAVWKTKYLSGTSTLADFAVWKSAYLSQ